MEAFEYRHRRFRRIKTKDDMWLELFLCLVFAHLMADYVLQTDKICKNKKEKKWRSIYHYGHAVLRVCIVVGGGV